jgi:hypothetical protein
MIYVLGYILLLEDFKKNVTAEHFDAEDVAIACVRLKQVCF